MAQAFDARRMAEAVAEVRYRMEQAAKAAGRDPKEILLCAVCKTRTPETIRDSAALPVDLFGENHMQELVINHEAGAYLDKPVHFIGHLQTNKVKKVVGKAHLIQSVDSLRLLEALPAFSRKIPILLCWQTHQHRYVATFYFWNPLSSMHRQHCGF